MRRGLSAALFALGVVLCSSAGRISLKAALAQLLLRSAWHDAGAGEARARPWPWADTWPVARLKSAAHGVDLIVLEGATGSTTAFAPGHILGTAEPGEPGNVGIAAHRDTHFAFLEQLRLGDELRLELPDGRVRTFEVASLQVVHQRDTSSLESAGNLLTLVTCFPFRATIPGGPLRYVVQANAVQANAVQANAVQANAVQARASRSLRISRVPALAPRMFSLDPRWDLGYPAPDVAHGQAKTVPEEPRSRARARRAGGLEGYLRGRDRADPGAARGA